MSGESRSAANQALILSGVAEIALGALTGWPYALLISDPGRARALGIRSGHRLRQWHLDLIALGALSVLAGTAIPDLPRHAAWPLGVGAWTNANAFGLLAFRPDAKDHPVYRAAVSGSFAAVTLGWISVARIVARRTIDAARPRAPRDRGS
jgi:hypothetical protein